MSEVTRILEAIEQGDRGATEELLPLVYDELRVLAAQKMAQERPGQTLQATALVHEAYLRLVQGQEQTWNSKGHFFKAAAEAMRRILIENARRRKGVKHGGDHNRLVEVELDNLSEEIDMTAEDLLALDDSLGRLAAENETLSKVVELHCFAGLPLPHVAGILGFSSRTAERYWAFARAWLYRDIFGEQ